MKGPQMITLGLMFAAASAPAAAPSVVKLENPFLELGPQTPPSRAVEPIVSAPRHTTAVADVIASLMGEGALPLHRRCNIIGLYDALTVDSNNRLGLATRAEALATSVSADVEALSQTLKIQATRAPTARSQILTQLELLQNRRDALTPVLEDIARRQADAVDGLWGRGRDYLRSCVFSDARTATQQLAALTSTWELNPGRPLLGTSQPAYSAGSAATPVLPQGTVTPAYSAQGAVVADDLSARAEIVLTDSLRAKATSLSSAAGAYDFVKNDLRLEWRWGAAKQTDITLREGAGSQAELAGVLVALLRAQGTPARYVWGTIETTAVHLAGQMGWLTEAEAADVGSVVLDAARRRAVLDQLTGAGTPWAEVGGDIRLGHVWVEASLPMGSYRGVNLGDEGKEWVAIEPSLTGIAKLSRSAPLNGLFTVLGQSPQQLAAAYLDGAREGSFLKYVRARLATTNPALTLESLQTVTAPRPERLDLLPGTLPYRVISVQGEAASLPDSLLHRLKLEVRDRAGITLSWQAPMYEVTSQRTVLTHRPATADDAALMAAAGGLYQAPPSAMWVRSVIHVNGQEKALSASAARLGDVLQLHLEVGLPGSATAVDNQLIAGNVVALGVAAPGNVFDGQALATDLDGPAVNWLYARAAAYSNAWTDSEDVLAGLLDVRLARRSPSVVFVENQLAVEESLGVRTRVVFKGIEVDADVRTVSAAALNAHQTSALMRLSGIEGSSLEAQVLQEATGEDAISTTGVLQEAVKQSVSVLTLATPNASLVAAPDIIHAVEDALAIGREVTLPSHPLTVRDWTGAGLIIRDARTDAASYLLAGGVAGGQTIVTPDAWADQALVDLLSTPERGEPITDVSRVARITRVRGTELQETRLGDSALSVGALVTTAEGAPVSGATVTFNSEGGGFSSSGSCPTAVSTITATTDANGVAKVRACPNTNLARQFMLRNNRKVGITRIAATTSQSVSLAEPFVVLAHAGPLAELRPLSATARTSEGGLSLLGALMVRALDAFGNELPGEAVAWSQGSAEGRFFTTTAGSSTVRALQLTATDQVTNLSGSTDALGISAAGYIPPSSGPVVTVQANAASVTQAFAISLRTDNDYTLRLTTQLSASRGVWGTEFDKPVIAQVMKRSGAGSWVQLASSDPGVTSYSGQLRGFDSNGALLDHDFAEASDVLNVYGAPDTADTLGFWPRHRARSGVERVRVTAQVVGTKQGEAAPSTLCCDTDLELDVASETATLTPATNVGVLTTLAPVLTSTISHIGFAAFNPASNALSLSVQQSRQVADFKLGAGLPPSPLRPLAISIGPAASTVTPLVTHHAGGRLTARLYGPRPSLGPTGEEPIQFIDTRTPSAPTTETFVDIIGTQPAVTELSSQPATMTFLRRTFANQRDVPSIGGGLDVTPLVTPGALSMWVNVEGDLQVYRGAQRAVAASGRLMVDGGVVTSVELLPDGGGGGLSLRNGVVTATLAPGAPLGTGLSIELTAFDGTVLALDAGLTTVIHDVGVRLPGNTVVNDVDVATGHLVKQHFDVALPGRGGGLKFVRTYASNTQARGPLGVGWQHTYGLELRTLTSSTYLVIGPDGHGEAFDCTATCISQAGHFNSLTRGNNQWVYTTREGVSYRFESMQRSAGRHLLEAITDRFGHTSTLTRADAFYDHHVLEVLDASGQRKLAFTYTREGERVSMSGVRLVDAQNRSLGLCLGFSFDSGGNLASATRDGCTAGAAARTQHYTYDATALGVAAQTNLASLTDENGNTTHYQWYAASDFIEGENDHLFFGVEQRFEHLKAIQAPLGVTTTFTYNLVEQPDSTFITEVKPARTDVAATAYHLESAGHLTSSVGPAGTTQQSHTAQHQLKDERDARGRLTSFVYDAHGNMLQRRIQTAVLPAMGIAQATEQTVDSAGAPVSEIVETWAYDAFGQWTCHTDAEGRATSRVTDATTGALTAERHHTVLHSGCAAAPTTSSTDIVRRVEVVGVNSATTPTGALRGDIARRIDGNGHETRILAYDGNGQVLQTLRAGITTTTTHDARGQLLETSDSVGRRSSFTSDALERVVAEFAFNTKPLTAPSPGRQMTFEYYPQGQRKRETNHSTGLVRTYALDALNRVTEVSESGGGLVDTLRTTTSYDAHDNVISRTDRRGVTTSTVYDMADRAVKTIVRVCDETSFAAQGGESGTVGLAVTAPTTVCSGTHGLVSSKTYDAVGNLLFEVDGKGHRRDWRYDALYRVVAEVSPTVPGATLGAAAIRWTSTSRFDKTGNPTRETDGNGHSTARTYDFKARLSSVTDAVGHVISSSYDGNDNVVLQVHAHGTAEPLRTSTTFDALDRPLDVSQAVAKTGSTQTLVTRTRYDDVAHHRARLDARGFVTLEKMDDLDRVYEQTADTSAALGLSRTPDSTDVLLTTPLELTSRFGFNGDGLRTRVTDAKGRTTTEVFDGLGRLSSRQRPMGVSETFTSDGEGHVIKTVDARGIVRHFTFDARGRPRRSTLVESMSNAGLSLETKRIEYTDTPDTDGLNRESTFDARGLRNDVLNDGLGRPVRTTDALGHTTQTSYDATLLREAADKKAFVTRYSYDGVGRLIQQTDATDVTAVNSFTQTWLYDDEARTLRFVDRSGIATVTTFDGLGRTTQVVRGAGMLVHPTTSTLDAAGNVVAVLDANNHRRETVFDALGRKVRDTIGADVPAVREETRFTHDAVGNVVSSKSLRVHVSAFDVRHDYDDLDRLVRSETALGLVTSRAFDAAGNLICIKEPNAGSVFSHGAAAGMTVAQLEALVCTPGWLTRFTFDEEAQQTSITNALGGVTQLTYDVTRNLVARRDARDHVTTYTYDARNQRTAEYLFLSTVPAFTRDNVPAYTMPSPSFTSGTLATDWEYDANGNHRFTRDGKGQTSTRTFELLNRLSLETFANDTSIDYPQLSSVASTYTGNGELLSTIEVKATGPGESATEVTTHTYDGLERRSSTTFFDGKSIRFGYDLLGNRTSVTDPGNVVTSYTHDAANRIATVVTPAGTVTYGYLADGRRSTTRLPGVLETRCYDADGRLTVTASTIGLNFPPCVSTGAAEVARHELTYDANGNRIRLGEARSGPLALTDYGYSQVNRLIGVRSVTQAVLYSLDANGNRLGTKSAPSGLVPALTAGAYAALVAPNIQSQASATFNAVGWLMSTQESGQQTISFTYDANGNRVSSGPTTYSWNIRNGLSSLSVGGSTVATYDYDALRRRTRRVVSGNVTTYVMDGNFILNEANAAGALTRRYHPAEGRAVAVSESSGIRWTFQDPLGSHTDEVTTAGTITIRRRYDTWGAFAAGTAPTLLQTRMGYLGGQYNEESGLTYWREGHYDPINGVMLSRSVERRVNPLRSFETPAELRESANSQLERRGQCSIREHREL